MFQQFVCCQVLCIHQRTNGLAKHLHGMLLQLNCYLNTLRIYSILWPEKMMLLLSNILHILIDNKCYHQFDVLKQMACEVLFYIMLLCLCLMRSLYYARQKTHLNLVYVLSHHLFGLYKHKLPSSSH